MALVDRIEKQKRDSVMEQLKDEKLPLFLWGIGDVGNTIFNRIQKNGIHIQGVLLDVEHSTTNWRGLDIYDVGSDKLPSHYSVIVGHSAYEKIDDFKAKDERIACIYRFTTIAYADEYIISWDYFYQHIYDYEKAFELLADKKSKDCFVAFINAIINDDSSYILPLANPDYTYFANDIWNVSDKEIYVDAGAYDGDTVKLFLTDTGGKYNKVYAFEADPDNYDKLVKYVDSINMKDIVCKPFGLWSENGKLTFDSTGDQEARIIDSCGEKTNGISVVSIDSYFDNQMVTFIKINFSPGEKEVLTGATKVINRDKPRLAMTAGLNPDEIRELPILVNSINPNYKIYLRFQAASTARLILYACV